MNSFLIGIIAVFFLFLGYRFYGKLAEKLWSVDPSRKTPAVEFTDNVDYMPAKHWTILFGHHFASIAGAGPIIGPVVAVIAWGWVPAILWIILGSIFMGGVHDFSALMASLRYRGGSIGEVAQTVLSKRAKILFCGFLWLALVLVVAVFCAVTAKTLVNEPRIVLPTFGLIFVAILVGKMLYDWKVNQVTATVVGVGLLVLLFVLGYYFPITLNIKNPLNMWICVLLIYSYIASIAPVNLILQPRDYLSTFILFFGLVFGYAGLILSHPRMHAPAFVSIPGKEGPLWPMMFVSIACGAISGFHSLIASGTTSKQIASEKDARRIAYGSMIVEGVLACLALLAVSAGLYWAADPEKEGIR